MRHFEYSFVVNAPLDKVWAFHDDPTALPKVMTGPVKMHVHHVDRPLQPGSRILMTMQAGPIRRRWNVRLRAREAPRFFTDEQIEGEGPFRQWRHTHAFEVIDAQRTRVIDRLEYEPPFGLLGKIADALFGSIIMRGMFASRARATRRWLESQALDEAAPAGAEQLAK
ncbi:MAG: SRPBCC family protein [Anaerolineae bacterium]|nr:SRPBCC family protein [Candidatus Roseilinea sp.]MDW8450457.1 SRPBCC family protein [Anaerolineae bacterium]